MATPLTDQLNALFLKWHSHSSDPEEGFLTDGIIDEAKWKESKRKVLFLAKEPNKPCDGHDLRRLWSKNIWNTPDTWAYGLQNLERARIPDYADALVSPGSAFWSSAMVNLKKTPGGGKSNSERLRESVAKDWGFIQQELDIISPDVVVCCGTFAFIRSRLGLAIESNADERWYRSQDTVWIDYYHPSAHFPKSLMYYGLVGAYHNFLAKR